MKHQVKLTINRPTVLIVKLDSLEINRLKEIEGEDNFYTAADDLMWYNAMLLNKLDSLKIPVEYVDKDTFILDISGFSETIVKDTTFSIYTYFYFDGKEIKRTDVFKLLDK